MPDGPGLALAIALILLVLTVTIGFVVVRRRRAALPTAPPAEAAPTPTLPQEPETVEEPPTKAPRAPPTETPVAEAEPEPVEAEPVEAEPEPVEAEPEREPVEVEPEPEPEPEPTRGRVRSLRARLAKMFGKSGLTAEDFDELEEILLRADVGVAATTDILDSLRATDGDLLPALEAALLVALGTPDRSLHRRADGTSVWLITGVNGSGKTTTIGKLAAQERREGRTVVLAAADTFRAAADAQLETWAERAGATVVKHQHGADPAAVVFDAAKAAGDAKADLLVVDTAGRLQNKKNLMDELEKIHRVLEREAGSPDETLLILDATTGQNGLSQARAFAEAANVTGIVLTKLDGSAKGGIVIGVQRELGIPVKLVGLGEGIDDLAPFDPATFVKDLLA